MTAACKLFFMYLDHAEYWMHVSDFACAKRYVSYNLDSIVNCKYFAYMTNDEQEAITALFCELVDRT